MSLAAGIAVRVEDHRDNDPVTRVEPHGSAACEGSHLARQLQRTAHVQDEADAISHVLEVLEEPRRPASCSTARPHSYLALRTEFGASAQIRGLAREGRESAARRAWRSSSASLFEPSKAAQDAGAWCQSATTAECAADMVAAAKYAA